MGDFKKKYRELISRGIQAEEDYVEMYRQTMKKALQEVKQIQQGDLPKKSAWDLIDKNVQQEFTDQYMKMCELLHYCQVKRELEWVSKLTPIRDAMDKVYCEGLKE